MVFFARPLYAQELSALRDEKPLEASGGISISQIGYASINGPSRRTPYNLYMSGNLNLSIYGYTIPLSLRYSNQQARFRQPFNQLGLSPSYKWVKAYIGYSSMNFSPYTFHGHIFNGAGFVLTPSKVITVSMLYGRLRKETPALDSAATSPSFKRMGYGLKIELKNKKDHAHITFFHAGDQTNPLHLIYEQYGVTPQNNTVISTGAGKHLGKSFTANAEWATSLLTRDTRLSSPWTHPLSKIRSLHTNASSSLYTAFKTGLNYHSEKISGGLQYENVAPEYRTLGAYYFNNDLETISLNTNLTLNQKIKISARAGSQRDNINRQKTSATNRLVGSVNAAYSPLDRLSLSAGYSNFKTYTNVKPVTDLLSSTALEELDTLDYYQVSSQGNLSVNYQFSSGKTIKQNLFINISHQTSAGMSGHQEHAADTKFTLITIAHQLSVPNSNLTLSPAANISRQHFGEQLIQTLGPGINIARPFINKQLRLSLSAAVNLHLPDPGQQRSFVSRLGGTYKASKHHILSLFLSAVNRTTHTESGGKRLSELTGTLNYNFRF